MSGGSTSLPGRDERSAFEAARVLANAAAVGLALKNLEQKLLAIEVLTAREGVIAGEAVEG